MIAAFLPTDFTPTEHSSADNKARFANHFVRFVEGGFKRTVFPYWFYTRLSMCFGHIAHYNSGGFYDVWFSSPERRQRFLAHAMAYGCYGQPEFTYCDVEKALGRWLECRALQKAGA